MKVTAAAFSALLLPGDFSRFMLLAIAVGFSISDGVYISVGGSQEKIDRAWTPVGLPCVGCNPTASHHGFMIARSRRIHDEA